MQSAMDFVTIFFPQFRLIKWVLNKLLPPSVEQQIKVLPDLLEAGKKNGVDEMEVEVDNKVGAYFKSPIEGVNIEAGVGSKNTMKLKIKYQKNA